MHKGLPRSILRKHNKKRPKSTIERLVAAWLTTDGIPFRTEVKCGKCHIDVVVGKMAIEINGCYWHGCPRCFPSMSRKMQMKRFRDIKRYQFLGRKGYKIHIIWECDILGKPDETREILRNKANAGIILQHV